MSRPKRERYSGATYHVMSRGTRRLVLYKDEDDYLSFLESVLKTLLEKIEGYRTLINKAEFGHMGSPVDESVTLLYAFDLSSG